MLPIHGACANTNNNYHRTMNNCGSDVATKTQLRPSSPRQFFARLYGHLENNDNIDTINSDNNNNNQNSITISCAATSSNEFKTIETMKNIYTNESHHHPLIKSVNINGEKNVICESHTGDSISSPDLSICDDRIENVSYDEQTEDHLINQRKLRDSRNTINNIVLQSPFVNLPIGFHNETTFPANLTAFLARRRRKEGKQRRQRTTFSNEQTMRLEVEFHRNEYITRSRRFELAESLNLSETQIKIWFQNRRAKDKRIEKAQIDQQYRNFMVANGFMNSIMGQRSSHYPTHLLTNFQQNLYHPQSQSFPTTPNVCMNTLKNGNPLHISHHMIRTNNLQHSNAMTTSTTQLPLMDNSNNNYNNNQDNNEDLKIIDLNNAIPLTHSPYHYSLVNTC